MKYFRLKYLIYLFPICLFATIIGIYLIFPQVDNNSSDLNLNSTLQTSSKINTASVGQIGSGISSYLVNSITVEAPTTTSIQLPYGYVLDSFGILPTFVTSNGNELIINATKNNVGEYEIYLQDPLSDLFNETFYMRLSVVTKSVDTDLILQQIQSAIGNELNNYGFYVYDLKRDISFGFNSTNQYRAASMVKVPIAIAIMREVQEGRLSLDTIYPLRGDLIFNYYVGAGENAVGTPLTVKDYLTQMIEVSDNTSLSHLDAILGQTYGENLNSHLKDITGVDFYVNPPEATPMDVATVLKGLYSASFLNRENSDYIINLMKNAAPDLRTGVGLGVPEGIEFANKIGFLDTYEDLSYMDSAIIYGTSTDYVLVVMDKNQDWDVAQNNLKTISAIIYNNLN